MRDGKLACVHCGVGGQLAAAAGKTVADISFMLAHCHADDGLMQHLDSFRACQSMPEQKTMHAQ